MMGPNLVNDNHSSFTQNGERAPYTVSDHGIHEPRPMRLIVIGAGIAGIGAAYKYQHQLENVEFVVYEKNGDVGGTWLENQYPGGFCLA